jgi:phosphomannomutase
MNYIFDIDGTLTPSRLPIDIDFETFFLEWMKGKDVYLVTGSDKDKTIEQVGEKIWTNCKRAYQSCGNAVYEGGKLIRQLDLEVDNEIYDLLETFVDKSDWPYKFGNHIEERIGLLNFSTIGRKCPQNQRDDYYGWDQINKERKTLCKIIEDAYPDLEATVGGQISIDIYPKGKNKAQVLDDIKGPVTFFGDKCQPGGNDFPIVERLWKLNEDTKLGIIIHEVTNWTDTWEILRGFQPAY